MDRKSSALAPRYDTNVNNLDVASSYQGGDGASSYVGPGGAARQGWIKDGTDRNKRQAEALRRSEQKSRNCCCFSIPYTLQFPIIAIVMVFAVATLGRAASDENRMHYFTAYTLDNNRLWSSATTVADRLTTFHLEQQNLARGLQVEMMLTATGANGGGKFVNFTNTSEIEEYLRFDVLTESREEPGTASERTARIGDYSTGSNRNFRVALEDSNGEVLRRYERRGPQLFSTNFFIQESFPASYPAPMTLSPTPLLSSTTATTRSKIEVGRRPFGERDTTGFLEIGYSFMSNLPIKLSSSSPSGTIDGYLKSTVAVGENWYQFLIRAVTDVSASDMSFIIWNQTSQRIITSSSSNEQTRSANCYGVNVLKSEDYCSGVPSAYADSFIATQMTAMMPQYSKVRKGQRNSDGGQLGELPYNGGDRIEALEGRGLDRYPFTVRNPYLLQDYDRESLLNWPAVATPTEANLQEGPKVLRIPLPLFNQEVHDALGVNVSGKIKELRASLQALDDSITSNSIPAGKTQEDILDEMSDLFEIYLIVIINQDLPPPLWSFDVILMVLLSCLCFIIVIELVYSAQRTMVSPLKWIIFTSAEVEELDFTCLDSADQTIATQTNSTLQDLYKTYADMVWHIEAMSAYLSKEVVRELNSLGALMTQGSRPMMETKHLSVIFIDIANFTSICEAMTLEEFQTQISRYFNITSRTLLLHGCTIDKYIGDATVGFWGAPMEFEEQGYSACCAALHLKAVVARLKAQWAGLGHDLGVRIGVAQGPTLVGTIGSKDRSVYTAMGTTVNLANALEEGSKQYGTTILASKEVIRDANRRNRGLFVHRFVGTVERAEKRVDAYEVLGLNRAEVVRLLQKKGMDVPMAMSTGSPIRHNNESSFHGEEGEQQDQLQQQVSASPAEWGFDSEMFRTMKLDNEGGDNTLQTPTAGAGARNGANRKRLPASSSPQDSGAWDAAEGNNGGSDEAGTPTNSTTTAADKKKGSDNTEQEDNELLGVGRTKKSNQISQEEELLSIDQSYWYSKEDITVVAKLHHIAQIGRGIKELAPTSASGGTGKESPAERSNPLPNPAANSPLASPSAQASSSLTTPSGPIAAAEMLTKLMEAEAVALFRLGVPSAALTKTVDTWKRGKNY